MQTLEPKQFRFADFELDVAKRRLLKRGEALPLNAKAFDLLLVLVEHRGQVVSKDELLDKVWAGQFVEEGNLKVQVRALRKIFGEKIGDNEFIVTVPGRGYTFVADIEGQANEKTIESNHVSPVGVDPQVSENPVINAKVTMRPGWFQRNRGVVLVSALVLASLSLTAYFLQRSVRPLPFQQMSIRRLTSSGNVAATSISPDGKLFVYVVREVDNESLWIGHVDGGDPLQIRPPLSLVYLSVKFTPDSSSIYYTTSVNYEPGTLFRMPVFGGVPEKIGDNFKSITFSPDGKQFASTRYDAGRKSTFLIAADAKGGNEHTLAELPDSLAADWHSPAWSPDGQNIAVAARIESGDTSIFLVNLSDSSVRRMQERSWAALGPLVWLADGRGLGAVAVDKDEIHSQVWVLPFPDGEARRLTTDLSFYGFLTAASNGTLLSAEGKNQSNIWLAPSSDLTAAKQITFGSPGQDDGWSGIAWTSDGRIVYTADTDAGTNLWIMGADGKNQKQIVPNGGINKVPSVTTDGRFLVFQSNRSGRSAVWRSGLDGSDLRQLTDNGAAGEPAVSPDGKWVVYETVADDSGELWRMTIDGRDAVRLTDMMAEWPKISPDSRMVACGLQVDGKTKLAVLPIEGGKPLKLFDVPQLFNFRWSLHWTADGKALTYRDWSNGIWNQALDGGPPQRLAGLPEEKFAAFGWSPGGDRLAFTRLNSPRDVILIEDISK